MDSSQLYKILAPINPPAELSRYLKSTTKIARFNGCAAAGTPFLAAAIKRITNKNVVIVCDDGRRAEEIANDCGAMLGENALVFPSRDAVPYNMKSAFGPTTEARLGALGKVLAGEPQIIVMPAAALLQKTICARELFNSTIRIEVGCDTPLDRLTAWLAANGFRRENRTDDIGSFSLRGGILDVYPFFCEHPCRIDFFGDTVESIRSFDVFSQKSIAAMPSVEIAPMREFLISDEAIELALEKMSEDKTLDQTNVRKLEHQWKSVGDTDGLEWFLHWFDLQTESVLDYLPNDTFVMWDDIVPVRRRFENVRENYDRHIERVPKIYEDLISKPNELLFGDDDVVEKLSRLNTIYIDTIDVPSGAVDFQFSFARPTGANYEINALTRELRNLTSAKYKVIISCQSEGHAERTAELLGDVAQDVVVCVGNLITPFVTPRNVNDINDVKDINDTKDINDKDVNDDVIEKNINNNINNNVNNDKNENVKIAVYTDAQLFNHAHSRPIKTTKRKTGSPLASFAELSPGDVIVHVDHGIGRFLGVERVTAGETASDCMVITYAERAKVYVPVDDFHKVQKYVGKEGVAPALSKLGTSSWEKLKERTRESLREMAQELINLYAKRQHLEGITFDADNVWQREFEESFIYDETVDQLQAIKDVKKDMETNRPMDRLVCGDVGFGKTEVAMRAAFKAAMSGYQVALLAPTTILAAQHQKTFAKRMASFPVRVELMSRFRSAREQKETMKNVAEGKVDILIGTHRILSPDIKFKNLGLLIIDEEQRFGVKHKEKLKHLRHKIDTLSMTATPIPRTLHMSLIGARDLSIIGTPPRNRLPVETRVAEYHDELVKRAIEDELERGGQVYFVNNRIKNIAAVQDKIETLVPKARVAIAHGQMDETTLERVMNEFIAGRFDILLSTVIIENGLDIPNVNTIIVNRADTLGLSQLYQLRGRVGRSSAQAYAYFFTPPFAAIKEDSLKRLKAMEQYTDLGSGFQIAMRDLEIRGAGNILGNSQHGFIAAVGFDLYCKLLQEAVDELRDGGDAKNALPETRLDIPLQAYIPTKYISDGQTRISIYQELSALISLDDVAEMERGLVDRFGAMPESVRSLTILMRLKILGKSAGCSKIVITKDGVLDLFVVGGASASGSQDQDHDKNQDQNKNQSQDIIKDRIKKIFDSAGNKYKFEIAYEGDEVRLRVRLDESSSLEIVEMCEEVVGMLEGVSS